VRPDHSDVVIGGADPLDSRLGHPVSPAAGATWGWRRTRLALGLAHTPMPASLLLLIGAAIGPDGIVLISDGALASLFPVVAVALSGLGALIGLDVDLRRRGADRLLAAASAESLVAMLLVAAAVVAVGAFSLLTTNLPITLAVLLGICASPSASVSADASREDRRSIAARIGDLDDVLPLIAGGVVLAWLAEPGPLAAAWLMANLIGLSLAAACAGWLLMGDTGQESEQRVYSAAVLLMLGGAAAHLSSSALFAGFVAGVFWNAAGTRSRDRIARDVRYVQHPLIATLLLVAGASAEITANVVAVALLVAMSRLAAKAIGGAVAALVSGALPWNAGVHLVSPGLVGVAIALNVHHVWIGDGLHRLLLSIVVLSVVITDVMALFVSPAEAAG
jgi:hypothetical protein